MNDEAVRVAVGLRLGLQLCQTHRCPCGTTVDTVVCMVRLAGEVQVELLATSS
jgi:hypothetical protein